MTMTRLQPSSACWTEPERDGVRERGGQDGQHLERLRELEPEEGHGDGPEEDAALGARARREAEQIGEPVPVVGGHARRIARRREGRLLWLYGVDGGWNGVWGGERRTYIAHD
jgi:hypothetical protein